MTDIKNNNYKILIEITDKDVIAPYNHVHHAQILNYLEQCRTEWISQLGYPMSYWFSIGVFPVVRAISIEYLREIKIGEYQVCCECLELGRRNLLLSQDILNLKGKPMVSSEINLMFFDTKTGKGAVLDGMLSSRIAS